MYSYNFYDLQIYNVSRIYLVILFTIDYKYKILSDEFDKNNLI
jgi:hypothetical protein